MTSLMEGAGCRIPTKSLAFLLSIHFPQLGLLPRQLVPQVVAVLAPLPFGLGDIPRVFLLSGLLGLEFLQTR